jgi:hypothetical protein
MYAKYMPENQESVSVLKVILETGEFKVSYL